MKLGVIYGMILCSVVERWSMEILALLEEWPAAKSENGPLQLSKIQLTVNGQNPSPCCQEPPTHRNLPYTRGSRS